ncbi:MAG: flavodoxin family protein [Eggerthellaceae bacterium]|nr:flavodoxin family protein [Eggerthellaceae bacterium]
MKRIVAVNAGPRKKWNTAQMIAAACEGAKEAGAQIEYFDLFDLDKFTGCISCFGCKLEKNLGHCICKDGLTQVLEAIRTADGLIIGTPNYLSEGTASFRALIERIIFQYITYKSEIDSYNTHPIPVVFIMTSNAPDEAYEPDGYYHALIKKYEEMFNSFVGPTTVIIAAGTKQVNDYPRYNWTRFDAEARIERHETVFPQRLECARKAGASIVKD